VIGEKVGWAWIGPGEGHGAIHVTGSPGVMGVGGKSPDEEGQRPVPITALGNAQGKGKRCAKVPPAMARAEGPIHQRVQRARHGAGLWPLR